MSTLRLLLPLVLASGALHGQIFLVNDDFADTDRIGGLDGSATTTSSPAVSTPTSSNTQWVGTRVNQLVASSSGMLWTLDSSSRLIHGYFPPVSINATPTTFTLTFTTGAAGATANSLRFALVNGAAAGARSTDGVASTDDSYVGDLGYAFFSISNVGGPSTATSEFGLRERSLLTSNNILGTANDWTSLGTSSGSTGHLAPNTTYALSFELATVETGLALKATLSGGNLTGYTVNLTDTTPATLTYDTIMMRLAGGSAQFATVNFESLTVTQVPEPGMAAALVGAGALGLVVLRRRRR